MDNIINLLEEVSPNSADASFIFLTESNKSIFQRIWDKIVAICKMIKAKILQLWRGFKSLFTKKAEEAEKNGKKASYPDFSEMVKSIAGCTSILGNMAVKLSYIMEYTDDSYKTSKEYTTFMDSIPFLKKEFKIILDESSNPKFGISKQRFEIISADEYISGALKNSDKMITSIETLRNRVTHNQNEYPAEVPSMINKYMKSTKDFMATILEAQKNLLQVSKRR